MALSSEIKQALREYNEEQIKAGVPNVQATTAALSDADATARASDYIARMVGQVDSQITFLNNKKAAWLALIPSPQLLS